MAAKKPDQRFSLRYTASDQNAHATRVTLTDGREYTILRSPSSVYAEILTALDAGLDRITLAPAVLDAVWSGRGGSTLRGSDAPGNSITVNPKHVVRIDD